jgi:hypothetical protein
MLEGNAFSRRIHIYEALSILQTLAAALIVMVAR